MPPPATHEKWMKAALALADATGHPAAPLLRWYADARALLERRPAGILEANESAVLDRALAVGR